MPEITPEFFDIFGLLTFSLILYIGFVAQSGKGKVRKWMYFALIMIGILGLAVDGAIVYSTFIF